MTRSFSDFREPFDSVRLKVDPSKTRVRVCGMMMLGIKYKVVRAILSVGKVSGLATGSNFSLC